MRKWRSYIGMSFILASAACTSPAPAEEPPARPEPKRANLVMYGVAKDLDTGDTLRTCTVRAFDTDHPSVEVDAYVNAAGVYELLLTEERSWMVECSAPGREPKRVLVHLQGPPEEDWIEGYGMNTDFRLVERLPGVDLSLGLEPWGIARYDPGQENFIWDSLHTAGVRERFRAVRERAMEGRR